MKKCPYCGKTQQDEEVCCTVDQTPLVYFEEQPQAASTPVQVEPFFKHVTFSARDLRVYGILAFLFFMTVALMLCGFDWVIVLAGFPIFRAYDYASERGHLTQLAFRKEKIVEK